MSHMTFFVWIDMLDMVLRCNSMARVLEISGNFLDHTNGHSPLHVANRKPAKGRALGETFDAKWLGGHHRDEGSIARLDKRRILFEDLARAAVHFGLNLIELTRNVGSVTVQDGRVAGVNLSRVVHHNHLGFKRRDSRCGVLVCIRSYVSSSQVFHSHVLDVESDVVPRGGLRNVRVMHLDGLDFRRDVGRSEFYVLGRAHDTGLDTSHRHGSDATDLVHVLKRNTEWLVCWALWGVDMVERLEEERTFVPCHVGGTVSHVVSNPSRNGDESDFSWFVAQILQVGGDFLLDFVVTLFRVVDRPIIHLVDSDNHLLHTKRVGEEGVLTSLADRISSNIYRGDVDEMKTGTLQ
jgi:hypothetical protein